MMFYETSSVHYLTVSSATRHDRPGLFIICAHRRYSLESVSLLGHFLHLERAYKRVRVVGKVQVHPIHCLLDTQDTNGTSGMAVLYTRMP